MVGEKDFVGTPSVVGLGEIDSGSALDVQIGQVFEDGREVSQAHILVSEPSKLQRYYVLSLDSKRIEYSKVYNDKKSRRLKTTDFGGVFVEVGKSPE